MNLDPKVVKMRDALIERIKDKSPKEIANIVNEILLNESNNINRLAALSARVELLKKHIKSTFNLDDKKRSIRNVEKFNLTDGLEDETGITKEDTSESDDNWTRVEMIKSGVVNGVRFPDGVVIDVSQKDALKLIEDGLAKPLKIENVSKEKAKQETETEAAEDTATTEPVKEDTNSVTAESQTVTEPVKQETETKVAEDKATTEPVKENINNVTAEDTITEPVKQETETEAAEDTATTEPVKEDTNSVTAESQTVTEPVKQETETKVAEDKATTEPVKEDTVSEKIEDTKILKKKSTKITEETIELTNPKAVAEALGLNEAKKKAEEPEEIEEVLDIEALETGKK